MINSHPTLFLEINNKNLIFIVGKTDQNNILKIEYKLEAPLKGIENNRISNFDDIFKIIKENIFLVEQKFSYTFKELVLILENLNPSFVNISGYKNLNGSQILRENITYILNTLKNSVEKIESKKMIIHIFNSKFNLDNKKIENLPIGLFGDFYSHELSFSLISLNNHKNLISVFEKCNLRVKKILIKSFVKGANICDNNKDIDTFFEIRINEKDTKIFLFENNCLKFEQDFKFGTDIIIQDISKITTLSIEEIKIILEKIKLSEDIPKDEILEKEFFKKNNFRKIKKKLIYEVALARIKEILEILFFENVNFKYYDKFSYNIFIEIEQKILLNAFKVIFEKTFNQNGYSEINFINLLTTENLLNTANKLVHFGWKNEAIPVTTSKKSKIRRFFDAIFG